jgi:hypothetical protein
MMANSSDVVSGADARASEYNNLRADVLNTSSGHTHTGGADGGKPVTHLANAVQFVSAVTRYYSISPADCVPYSDSSKWLVDFEKVTSSDTTTVNLYFPVHLPHGAILKQMTIKWFRDDASASGSADLLRTNGAATSGLIASANSNATTGYHDVSSAVVTETIDNSTLSYCLVIVLAPNDSNVDVKFGGAIITYTIANPLP